MEVGGWGAMTDTRALQACLQRKAWVFPVAQTVKRLPAMREARSSVLFLFLLSKKSRIFQKEGSAQNPRNKHEG